MRLEYRVTGPGGAWTERLERYQEGGDWVIRLSSDTTTSVVRFDTLFNTLAWTHVVRGDTVIALRRDSAGLRGGWPDSAGRTRQVVIQAWGVNGGMPPLMEMQRVEVFSFPIPGVTWANLPTWRHTAIDPAGKVGAYEFDVSEERISVPAGTFDAVRFDDVKGRTTYWVRADQPRTLLRMETRAPRLLGGGVIAGDGAKVVYELTATPAPGGGGSSESGSAEELLRLDAADFEVLAPDSLTLREGAAAAAALVSAYTAMFETAPPRFAIVLYGTSAQGAAHRSAEYRQRGVALSKWPAYGHAPDISMDVLLSFPELGFLAQVALTGPDADRIVARVIIPGTPAEAAGVRAGDEIVAWDGEPIRSPGEAWAGAAERLAARRAKLEDGSVVELQFSRSGVIATARMQTASAAADQQTLIREFRAQAEASIRSRPDGGRITAAVVAHETMHVVMLDAFSGARFPAWYMEGVATLVENAAPGTQRADHRKTLRAHRADLIPLSALLQMPNPGSGGIVAPAAELQKLGTLFYPQSVALLEFLMEREGTAVVGRLGSGFAGGASFEDQLQNLSRMPQQLAAFEHAWLDWLDAGSAGAGREVGMTGAVQV